MFTYSYDRIDNLIKLDNTILKLVLFQPLIRSQHLDYLQQTQRQQPLRHQLLHELRLMQVLISP